VLVLTVIRYNSVNLSSFYSIGTKNQQCFVRYKSEFVLIVIVMIKFGCTFTCSIHPFNLYFIGLGVLEKFFDDPKKVERVRNIFTGLYSMDKVFFCSMNIIIIFQANLKFSNSIF
jgi:hypothetical protein